MKSPLKTMFILAALAAAPLAQASNVPGLDVTIKKNGKAVHQATTDARGSFTTGSFEPGAYNVEFRSPKGMNLKGQQLAISVSAGKGAPRRANAEG
ncbi:hypothetical protein BH20VER1_BH20VER1_12500 [soil metagenome]